MGFLSDLIHAFIRSFLGESAQEKEFRQRMEEAKKLYDFGWQYNKLDDLSKAASLAESLIDENAADAMQVFQKYRLLCMIYIKSTEIAIKEYKSNMKHNIERAKTLKQYDLATLEPMREELLQKIEQIKGEIAKMRTLPQSRKHDKETVEIEALLQKTMNEEDALSNKIDGLHQLETNATQVGRSLKSEVETYAEKLVMYFSKAKDVEGLNKEEKIRTELLLKSNWEEFKTIQESLAKTQAEYKEVLGIDLS